MLNKNTASDLFAAIDGKDSAKFNSFLTEDGQFIFSNMPPVQGKENIYNFLEYFFGSIKSLSHSIMDYNEVNNYIYINGIVTYTRHDDTTLTVKFQNKFTMESGLVKIYDIYMDASELYKQ